VAGHQSYSDFVRHKIFHYPALYWILDNKQRWKIRVAVWLLLDGFEWTFLGLKLNVEAGHQSYSDFVRHKIFHSRALYWILDNKQRWKIRVTVWLLLDGFE
jgi:predicted NACHT family NTPase